MMQKHHSAACNIGYPGPMTAAAAEVQGQKILTDMAGRVVVRRAVLPRQP